jgi:hypothetical protein
VSALFPTPPAPISTSLYSVIDEDEGCVDGWVRALRCQTSESEKKEVKWGGVVLAERDLEDERNKSQHSLSLF